MCSSIFVFQHIVYNVVCYVMYLLCIVYDIVYDIIYDVFLDIDISFHFWKIQLINQAIQTAKQGSPLYQLPLVNDPSEKIVKTYVAARNDLTTGRTVRAAPEYLSPRGESSRIQSKKAGGSTPAALAEDTGVSTGRGRQVGWMGQRQPPPVTLQPGTLAPPANWRA